MSKLEGKFGKHKYEGKTLIAVCFGNKEFRDKLKERNITAYFYNTETEADEWLMKGAGGVEEYLYALEERDRALFNAYEDMPEGYEMFGYGDETTPVESYEYMRYYHSLEQECYWDGKMRFCTILNRQYIYCRKKKEEEPTLKLEAGCRYVRKDGVVTGKLIASGHRTYCFADSSSGLTYMDDGRYSVCEQSKRDLVAKYEEGEEPILELELDCRYLRRDGQISGGLVMSDNKEHPFKDPENGITYRKNGSCSLYHHTMTVDLISKYEKSEEDAFEDLWESLKRDVIPLSILDSNSAKDFFKHVYDAIKAHKNKEASPPMNEG